MFSLGLLAKYKDILKKLFITFLILAIYKVTMLIVIPGTTPEYITIPSKQLTIASSFLNLTNFFAGGAIERCSILAINIAPYLTSTTIIQFLSSKSGIKFFKNLKQDKDLGAAKLNEWTQYLTLFIATIQAIYYCMHLLSLERNGNLAVYLKPGWLFMIIAVPLLVTGTMLVVWIANQISKYGVGQGVSLIIFSNIITNLYSSISKIYEYFRSGLLTTSQTLIAFSFIVSMFLLVIFVEGCTRYIPIRYSGIQGRRTTNSLPLKVNNAGVFPSVIASSFLFFPQIILGALSKLGFFTENIKSYAAYISHGGPYYFIFYAGILAVITISQTEMSFDPDDISENLQKSGIIVVGHMPGEATSSYLRAILNRLNILAAGYLIIVCVGSEWFCQIFNNSVHLSDALSLNGSTVLITVSVAQLIFKSMKHYDYSSEIKKLEV